LIFLEQGVLKNALWRVFQHSLLAAANELEGPRIRRGQRSVDGTEDHHAPAGRIGVPFARR
jgi:hypothetical protein